MRVTNGDNVKKQKGSIMENKKNVLEEFDINELEDRVEFGLCGSGGDTGGGNTGGGGAGDTCDIETCVIE